MRRSIATVAVLSFALTACGGSSSDGASPPSTEEPIAAATAELEPAPSATDSPVEPEPEPEPDPDDPGSPDEEPVVDEPSVEEPVVAEPSVEEPAPAPEVVWPDDGCSADNSPTPATAAEGPAPAIEVRPESVDGPLPDLAVRRINCKGGWENLRNELPADRPLLVWFWAPH